MEILRTPEECFANLKEYPFTPHYVDVGDVCIHFVDEGPADAPPVLMLHGEPTWSYLYRKIIPVVTSAGFRAIAPDLVGFGKSDKPTPRTEYTYQKHVDWMRGFLLALDLKNITLVCHDWGGLIGLRLAAENEERFARIITTNTFLPTGDIPAGEAFLKWRKYSQETPNFHAGGIVKGGCKSELPQKIIDAYNAPFPDDKYKEGARQFPTLVPVTPDDPASELNRKAWGLLSKWEKPFLTAFGDSDPITRGADKFLQMAIPGAKNQPHVTIKDAAHFIQEDKPEELSRTIVNFLKQNDNL